MTPNHFTLHEVASGVWEAEADLTGASVGNAAIIDAGGKTIVVDTFMTDVAAEELRTTAEALTGNRVFLAVNSHWHADHTNGNQVFADVPIVSTRETMGRIIEAAPEDIGAWQAEIDASIAATRGAAEAGDAAARHRMDTLGHFRRFADTYRLVLPDLLIEDRLVIEGERRVEIITHGRGHTVSDTIVWLPAERVIVTGDLCWHGIHPRTQDGFPTDWATYTERLIELDPAHVIPGHGIPGDAEALAPLPDYFRSVAELVDAVADGADPNEIEAPPGSESWAGLERFRTGIELLAAG